MNFPLIIKVRPRSLPPHQLHVLHVVMFIPKFSINQIFNAVVHKRVYDAFHDEVDNAPSRIRELAETVKHLDDVLDNLRKVMEWYGLCWMKIRLSYN